MLKNKKNKKMFPENQRNIIKKSLFGQEVFEKMFLKMYLFWSTDPKTNSFQKLQISFMLTKSSLIFMIKIIFRLTPSFWSADRRKQFLKIHKTWDP